MARIWILVAVLVIALLVFRRSLGAGRRPPPRRGEHGETPQTLVCAECGTRYDPNITGWVCPRCRK